MSEILPQDWQVDSDAFSRELEAYLSDPEPEILLSPEIRKQLEGVIHKVIEHQKEHNPGNVEQSNDWVSTRLPITDSSLVHGVPSHGVYIWAKVMERLPGAKKSGADGIALASRKLIYQEETTYDGDEPSAWSDELTILFRNGASDVTVFWRDPRPIDGHRDESLDDRVGLEVVGDLETGFRSIRQQLRVPIPLEAA